MATLTAPASQDPALAAYEAMAPVYDAFTGADPIARSIRA